MYYNLIKLFITILFFLSCVNDIKNPVINSESINWINIDYNQIDNKLFLQLEVISNEHIVDSVNIKFFSKNFNDTILLNDNGVNGDLISGNNRFSAIKNIDLPFEEYQLETIINGFETTTTNFTIDKQYSPQINEIIFIKNINNINKEFYSNDVPFYINTNDTSYLKFILKIEDKNGEKNILSVRYKTETIWYNTDGDGCECTQEQTCIYSSPTFYLDNLSSTLSDSIFVYTSINDYIHEPGFNINPTSVCNRTGVIKFTFTIFDSYFGPQTFIEELLFVPCSDLNCTENMETCCNYGCQDC